MPRSEVQTLENHVRIVPAYHYVAFGLVAINLVWRLYRLVAGFSIEALVSLGVALALLMVFGFARTFALRVQDRVIRLEMRLRLAELAPDLKPRIGEFTVNQLCALRFASDGELPALARQVLNEKLDDRKAIKRRIQTWEPDWLRV
jgi:hypothetical protein